METGEVFDTVTDCARYLDGDTSTIAKCIRGERDTYRNLHFERVDKDRCAESRRHASHGRKPGRPRIRVRIVETGDIFDSISECARVIGGDNSEIAKCLKGYRNRKMHLGLHFESVEDEE